MLRTTCALVAVLGKWYVHLCTSPSITLGGFPLPISNRKLSSGFSSHPVSVLPGNRVRKSGSLHPFASCAAAAQARLNVMQTTWKLLYRNASSLPYIDQRNFLSLRRPIQIRQILTQNPVP